MIEPTKENLKESYDWRRKMVGAYRRNDLTKQQIQQLEKIPNWAWEYENSADKKKEKLLKLAKNRKPKPKNRTKLSKALNHYLNPNSSSYDKNFTKKIKKICPNWFKTHVELTTDELLKLAKSGAQKPAVKTKLGDSLRNYTIPSRCYQANFTKKLRAIRPDWLENSTSKLQKELIDLAKNGEPRPKCGTRIYEAFLRYTTGKCYDAAFIKKIQKLCPDWLESVHLKKSKEIKKELLKLAKSGAPKPKWGTKYYNVFNYYANENSKYRDLVFVKKIRILRPDWFQVV